VVGGGFGGVVTAESLAKRLGSDHQITLVSRSRKFLSSPSLIRFAFGQSSLIAVSLSVSTALLETSIKVFFGFHSLERGE
jgi:NADH dehydrogenase FAD-containing subunit